jgi:hypothetical protein
MSAPAGVTTTMPTTAWKASRRPTVSSGKARTSWR